MRRTGLVLGLLAGLLPMAAMAQDRALRVLVDASLAASGLVDYAVPRFALKHGLRPEVVPQDGEAPSGGVADADVVLFTAERVGTMAREGLTGAPQTAFREAGGRGRGFAVAVVAGAAHPREAALFRDWLLSGIGQQTVASYAAPGRPAYVAGAGPVTGAPSPVFEGDAVEGERLAQRDCGRCHVVSRANRFGGIGSTPSFMALRALPDWEAKFQSFYAANPHPSFVELVGVTPPFDPQRPPHIAPVSIDPEDLDAILAYVAEIEPLDLGAPVEAR